MLNLFVEYLLAKRQLAIFCWIEYILAIIENNPNLGADGSWETSKIISESIRVIDFNFKIFGI